MNAIAYILVGTVIGLAFRQVVDELRLKFKAKKIEEILDVPVEITESGEIVPKLHELRECWCSKEHHECFWDGIHEGLWQTCTCECDACQYNRERTPEADRV